VISDRSEPADLEQCVFYGQRIESDAQNCPVLDFGWSSPMSIESAQTADWTPSEALEDRLSNPDTLRFPENWTLSRSWQRARTERDRGGPINDAERMVYLTGSDSPEAQKRERGKVEWL